MTVSLSDHFTYQKLLRFVAPSILMMIITSIYSIVDGFFVSNFVGKNSFAALNLIFPVIMALAAVGFMIGTGGSALIAKTLGEGKPREANEIFSMLVIVLAAGGAILSGVCIVFLRPISFAVGATDLTIDDCVLYGRVLLASLPFFMLQNSFQSFLATAEKPHFGLRVTVFAGLTNMVLDFLLVYVFPFGLLGAALATAFSQIVGALIPLVYFLRPNDSLLRLFHIFHADIGRNLQIVPDTLRHSRGHIAEEFVSHLAVGCLERQDQIPGIAVPHKALDRAVIHRDDVLKHKHSLPDFIRQIPVVL